MCASLFFPVFQGWVVVMVWSGRGGLLFWIKKKCIFNENISTQLYKGNVINQIICAFFSKMQKFVAARWCDALTDRPFDNFWVSKSVAKRFCTTHNFLILRLGISGRVVMTSGLHLEHKPNWMWSILGVFRAQREILNTYMRFSCETVNAHIAPLSLLILKFMFSSPFFPRQTMLWKGRCQCCPTYWGLNPQTHALKECTLTI